MVKFFNNFKSVKNQFLAVLCVNIIGFSHGSAVGWLSPFLPLLLSEASPLITGRISTEEASWIGAFLCVGGIFGNFFFSWLAGRYGRKISILLLALPHTGFWILVKFSDYVYHLYIARFLAGTAGGGLFVVVPIFVAEIADPKFRGTLGSLLSLSVSLGVLNGFITGEFLHYDIVPYVVMCLPLLFILSIVFLPETPEFLMKANKLEEAEKSLKFYNNYQENCTKEEQIKFAEELKNLTIFVNKRDENDDLRLSDFTTPAAKKGLFIGFVLMWLSQFSGCFAFINYTATIFKESGSQLDPNLCAIVLGVIQIFGTYTSTILVDKFGRKILLIISSCGAAFGLITMGTYTFLKKEGYELMYLDWVPVASLSFVVFIASLGILNLPFVVLAEVLPNKIRAVGSSVCISVISSSAFIILKTFPILIITIQLYGCMWLFAGFCLIGATFIIFIVPETKGKNLNIIEEKRMSLADLKI